MSSYSYNSATEELVSYDTPDIVKIKAQYTVANGLAGHMFWDLSTDKVGADSLIGISAGVFGSLDQTQNHLRYVMLLPTVMIAHHSVFSYPNSEWDNIRSNMGTIGTTTTTTSGTGSPTGTPGSGACSGVAAWSSTVRLFS